MLLSLSRPDVSSRKARGLRLELHEAQSRVRIQPILTCWRLWAPVCIPARVGTDTGLSESVPKGVTLFTGITHGGRWKELRGDLTCYKSSYNYLLIHMNTLRDKLSFKRYSRNQAVWCNRGMVNCGAPVVSYPLGILSLLPCQQNRGRDPLVSGVSCDSVLVNWIRWNQQEFGIFFLAMKYF